MFKMYTTFQAKSSEGADGELIIEGLASANTKDRDRDIIPNTVWENSKSVENYMKNPIILAHHDHSQPIGKAIELKSTPDGLSIKAKISKAAGNVYDLISEGVMTAFSVGFSLKDGDFDAKSGSFMITDLELYEISVVSVPANQDALFSISKQLEKDEKYLALKEKFIKKSTKGANMRDEEKKTEAPALDLKAVLAEVSSLVKSTLADDRAAVKAATDAEAEAVRKAKEADEKTATLITATATTAAENLIKDLKKELLEKDASLAETINGFKEAIENNSEDMQKEFAGRGKMSFRGEGNSLKTLNANQRDGLLFVSKLKDMSIDKLESFTKMIKSGMEHWDAGVVGQWEQDYSTRVQENLRELLILEPMFTEIPMLRPTMNMPINPEAGDATWIQDTALNSSRNQADETGDGTNTSTGATVKHQLDESVLQAYKLATREYIGYEEEEDSIVALAPIIREALTRRMAISADRAILRGTGAFTTVGYDPITGIANLGSNTTNVTVAGAAGWEANVTEDDIVEMRKNLRLYGLNPAELTLVVSHDFYFELLKLPNFKTVDVLGDKATIVTGQVGSIFGVKVVISQAFDNAAIVAGTVGTPLAVMVNSRNFVKGNLRGIMTEAGKDVLNQKRFLVSSRRFAFRDIEVGQGSVSLEIAA